MLRMIVLTAILLTILHPAPADAAPADAAPAGAAPAGAAPADAAPADAAFVDAAPTEEPPQNLSIGIFHGPQCCGVLGCFDAHLALLPLPQCPEELDLNMKLYTRQDPIDGQLINRDSTPSTFLRGVKTLIIIHGWGQSQSADWMHQLKDAALTRGDFNVIIVGWSGGSKIPRYFQSSANTQTVGAEIAFVVNKTLTGADQDGRLVHCVGHSLGAHVCGNVGSRLKIGRITGLDPAGPVFELLDISKGLNKDRADFVDVIHTNSRSLGTVRSLGHVDFYPNDGRSQPGCLLHSMFTDVNRLEISNDTNTTLEISYDAPLEISNDSPQEISIDIGTMVSCSHSRAYQYFTESILTPCFLSSRSCTSQLSMPLHCSSPGPVLQSMGFDSDQYPGRGIFYLTTNSTSPFCAREFG